MKVAILGPLLVEDGGQPIEVGGARLRALLIRLAASPGQWVPVSALVDALWSTNPPTDQVNALQSLVSRLRRALPQPVLIESGPAGYRLAETPESVDAVRFEQLAMQGHRELAAGFPDSAAVVLTEALALWRGPALTEVVDAPYAMAWAHRLDELRSAARHDRIEADLQLGRHHTLIAELEELTAQEPLRERSWGLRIRALAGSGRQSEALAGYEQFRRALADELGLDPSPELQKLQLAVLQGDPDLQHPTRPIPPRPSPVVAPRRTNLRSPLTSFIGRLDDVQELRRLLSTSRLVTLVGPGGAGKTRLASEVGAGLELIGADGVWLVELAPVTDPDDIASTLLGSIRSRDAARLARPASHQDALSRLVETMAHHDVVLLLDNCEHVIDAAAKLADYLLGRCPGLTVLATSREPLGIVGETLWAVRPLRAPQLEDDLDAATLTPAVQLFADRAALVRPGFTVNTDNTAAVSEICRRLDGLPLAIELAAARLRNLPVETVAARLGDRFRLLTGGSRTAMPRHQTLRAVVAWSWDLLTDSERRLAERMSVFPGGATAVSVEAICAQGDGPDDSDLDAAIPADSILELLTALADKSLLVTVLDADPAADHGGPRYRMLETIREFAAEQLLARGEVAALRRAHAQYFLALAETAEPLLRGHDQLIWMDRLTAERDNLLAGLRFAVEVQDAATAIRFGAALSWYWTLLGRHDEALTWVELALSVDGERPQEAYVITRIVHAVSAAGAGMGFPSPAALQELNELTAGVDTRTGHPLVALAGPALAMLQEDTTQAQLAVERNLDHADPWARAMLYLISGMMAENDGDMELMASRLSLAIKGFRELGDRWGIGTAVGQIGNMAGARGDFDEAILALEEARQMTTELRARDDEAFSLIQIGMLRVRMGDFAGGRREVDAAVRMAAEFGTTAPAAMARFALAMMAHYEGDDVTAHRIGTEVLGLLDDVPFLPPQVKGLFNSGIATFAVACGLFAEARSRLAEALAAVRATRDMPIAATLSTATADLMLALGEPARAGELLGMAVGLRGMEDVGEPDVKRISARVEAALGAEEYARMHAQGRALNQADALALLESAIG